MNCPIFFQVKIDNAEEAKAYGIETIPALIYFENTIPHLFEGNLANDNEVLGWLIHQVRAYSSDCQPLFQRPQVLYNRMVPTNGSHKYNLPTSL